MTDDPTPTAAEIMAREEPVDLPEGLVPPAPDDAPADDEPACAPPGDVPPARPGPDDPEDPARACAALPLNDFGNGQRYVRHFGEDVKRVPRIGWHVWSGSVWQHDPDEIEVRKLAQQLGALITREIPHLVLEDWQMQVLARERDLRARVKAAETRLASAPDEEERAAA
ncbi:MAG TPA: hypothetical protein PLL33_06835 [Paracoccus sp. (in: a-proteobacteria)]|nr:hypothetical protein [Paracoccus sp. (in: a-proteobacteria)]